MARPRLWHDRRVVVGSVSLGLVALGIAVATWALVNIIASTTGVPNELPTTRASGDGLVDSGSPSTPTVSADASGTAVPEKVAYPLDPTTGEVLGTLTIPALGQSFPVIEGTGKDELKKGVGHIIETAMPGEPDNCVISGHRDTVFPRLGELEEGDVLVMETATGTYTYEISQIRIVDKDDRTVVVHTDHAVLTVSTCYPFQYVGSAPDRYVLMADLVTR